MTNDTKALMALKKETADIVLAKVANFQKAGELHLPDDYSAPNALKAAWLMLQTTVDRDKRPALEVCHKASIANALLDMVVQGLNPHKKQCYPIVYGNQLVMQRSYFGAKAVTLRVAPQLKDLYAEVIYEGDEVEITIDRGLRTVTGHVQKFGNINDKNIAGAYAMAVDNDGNVVRCEVMTWEQLTKAWAMSQTKPVKDDGTLKPDSTHAKFAGEMAKKTVTNRLAKHFINASSDATLDLVVQAANREGEISAEVEAEAEIEEHANTEVIDIQPQEPKEEGQPVDAEWEPDEEERKAIQEEEMAEAEGGPGY